MSVVGFDFGADSCKIAVARRRVIDVLQNMSGHRKTPTMVGFQGKVRVIGDDAAAQYMNNYKNTVRALKRILGRHFDDPELKEEHIYLPNKLVKLPNGNVGINVSYNDESQTFSVEQLVAAQLTKLKQITEFRLEGQRVSDCVIACPPYWNDAQRRALLDAAAIAGLNVLRLVNETTAVALNYGILRALPEKDPIKVMFVDVGYASTNVSIVSFVAGKLQVLSQASDRNVGARSFDKVLVNHFAKYVKDKYKLDALADTKASLKLLKECERIKTVLSANVKVPFNIEYLLNDVDVSGSIDRDEFEALSADVLKRLLLPLQAALDQAGVKKDDLFAIEVVGGGSRIPAVARVLKEFFGKELSRTCDGDESVARGTALMCAMLSPSVMVRKFEVMDTTPYAIDIAWGPAPTNPNDTTIDVEDHALLFKPTDGIPSVKLISFKERPPFQLVARYANPETQPPTTNPCIARFVVSGMPAGPAPDQEGPGKIKVKVKLDMSNLTSVTSAQLLQDVKVEDVPPPAPAPAASPAPAAAAGGDTPMPDASSKPADAPPAPTPSPPAGSDKTATPMDEDPEEPASAAATPAPGAGGAAAAPASQVDASGKKFKIKTVRTDLKVAAFYTAGLSKKDIDSMLEKELAMAHQDRAIAETDEKRNELESYVLEMRNAVQGGHLANYVSDADRDKFVGALSGMEDWLYNDGLEAQKSDYVNRLKQLKDSGDPIAKRKWEAENRDQHAGNLKMAVGKWHNLANSADEKYAHIEKADRDKVLAECANVDNWLSQALSQQDRVPPTQNPVLTVAELQSRLAQLESGAGAIMNKPKPPPPKKEEPPAAASPSPAAGAAPADPPASGSASPGGDTPMPDAAPANNDGTGAADSSAKAKGKMDLD